MRQALLQPCDQTLHGCLCTAVELAALATAARHVSRSREAKRATSSSRCVRSCRQERHTRALASIVRSSTPFKWRVHTESCRKASNVAIVTPGLSWRATSSSSLRLMCRMSPTVVCKNDFGDLQKSEPQSSSESCRSSFRVGARTNVDGKLVFRGDCSNGALRTSA